MKQLNKVLVDKVLTALSGKRREKFLASVAILNESLAQGAWTLRGSVKANSGFYQGLCKVRLDDNWVRANDMVSTPEWCFANGVEHALSFGSRLNFMKPADYKPGGKKSFTDSERIALGIKVLREHGGLKLSTEVVQAWLSLIEEKQAAYKLLDEARPKPVITTIGLSPKVTKTLKETNLDIDLPTIKSPEIEYIKVPVLDSKGEQAYDRKTRRPLFRWKGIIKWSKGIVHGASRFSSGCEACGKHIPSGLFVPIEAYDRKGKRLISMWLGCDCARNIFGIKDDGLDRSLSKEA